MTVSLSVLLTQQTWSRRLESPAAAGLLRERVGSSNPPHDIFIQMLLNFEQMQIFQCFSPISNIKQMNFSESVISVFLSHGG